MATKPKVAAPLKKKKKTVEDTPVKKKKKVRSSKELALLKKQVTVGAQKRISKLNTKGMRSIIGDSAEAIQQLLESDSNESAIALMQKRVLQALVDTLPYAEHAIRKTKGVRGVYQFNSLITSIREVMIDMQSTRDKGAIGASMVERILRPAFLDIGMTIVQEEARLDTEIRDLLGIEGYRTIRTARKDATTRIAQTIQAKYAEAKQQAVTFLQG